MDSVVRVCKIKQAQTSSQELDSLGTCKSSVSGMARTVWKLGWARSTQAEADNDNAVYVSNKHV